MYRLTVSLGLQYSRLAVSFPPGKDPTGLCRHDIHVLYDICSAHVPMPVLAKFVLIVHIGAFLI